MANTLTNMTETMVQDEVLPALKLGLNPLNAFSFQASGDSLAVGDKVTVSAASAKTAGTYSSTFETGDTTVVGKSITMQAPVFSSWFVNSNLEAAPTIERFLASGREAAYAVSKSVVQGVLANFVEANIGSGAGDELVVTSADYDYSSQTELWSKLKAKGVNETVSAIHTIPYAASLIDDSRLTDASASGSDLIQSGELPPILGVRQFYTDAFPTAVTSENTGVIYTGKTTAAVATALPADVVPGLSESAGVRTIAVTDPDTGISLAYRTWYNSATGVYWGSVVAMYGTAFIQDAAVRAVSV
ncbi:MAG: hypothetical protein GY833_23980 [Aestuariibacter sp.]|nr:hypothetical protein [Aestuariibacter sp.]